MAGEKLKNNSDPLENIEGGLTVSIEGKTPAEGYAYSENEPAELVMKKGEDLTEMISLFIGKNYEQLHQLGMYVGVWESDGKFYIDVVKVAESEAQALQDAEKNGQMAIYNLKDKKVVYIDNNKK